MDVVGGSSVIVRLMFQSVSEFLRDNRLKGRMDAVGGSSVVVRFTQLRNLVQQDLEQSRARRQAQATRWGTVEVTAAEAGRAKDESVDKAAPSEQALGGGESSDSGTERGMVSGDVCCKAIEVGFGSEQSPGNLADVGKGGDGSSDEANNLGLVVHKNRGKATDCESPEPSAKVGAGVEGSPDEAQGGSDKASARPGWRESQGAAAEVAVGSDFNSKRPLDAGLGAARRSDKVARVRDIGGETGAEMELSTEGSSWVGAAAEARLEMVEDQEPVAEVGWALMARLELTELVGLDAAAKEFGVEGDVSKRGELKVKGYRDDITETLDQKSPRMDLILVGHAPDSECMNGFFDNFGTEAMHCTPPAPPPPQSPLWTGNLQLFALPYVV
jgi:hypothetical protein